MSVQIVQFRTDPERVGEVEEGIERLFAAIDEAAPVGIEYTAARVGDSPEFLLVLTLPDGAANPLLGIPAAQEFRSSVGAWAGGPASPATLHVVGKYAG